MTKISGNSAIINISLPPEMLAEIDNWSRKVVRNRSDFIREAVRRYLRSLKRDL